MATTKNESFFMNCAKFKCDALCLPKGEVTRAIDFFSNLFEVEGPIKDEVAVVRHDGASLGLGHPQFRRTPELGLKHVIVMKHFGLEIRVKEKIARES